MSGGEQKGIRIAAESDISCPNEHGEVPSVREENLIGSDKVEHGEPASLREDNLVGSDKVEVEGEGEGEEKCGVTFVALEEGRPPGFEDSEGEEELEDGGSVVNWDLEIDFDEGLEAIRAAGAGAGGSDGQVWESSEMGNKMSNCTNKELFGDGGSGGDGVKDQLPMCGGQKVVENSGMIDALGGQLHGDNVASDCGEANDIVPLSSVVFQQATEKSMPGENAVELPHVGADLNDDALTGQCGQELISNKIVGECLDESARVSLPILPVDGQLSSQVQSDSAVEDKLVEGSFMVSLATGALKKELKSHHALSDSVGKFEEHASPSYDTKGENSALPSEEQNQAGFVVVIACPVSEPSEKMSTAKKRGRPQKGINKKDHPVRSSSRSARASRSSDKSVAAEPSITPVSAKPSITPVSAKPSITPVSAGGRRGRKKGLKKKQIIKGASYDEFSRMRNHLKYLLHRIQYAQNLLDAYSSEGWRGQSLEKLRPEKELQRAKADINRSKMKIRDLFQRLDSMSAEGRFPEALFDDEGLIDSEDIFCAKCGSKDLTPGNDIVLCDGACDRGFHQFCLQPPLRTEDIPPGDEGWLCPACDCKVDCIECLNDSYETKLALEDKWEKVFPEAVAAAVGNELLGIEGLPSDDSEDNDYNPDGTDDDAKVEGKESSSDESDSAGSDSSDFSSASEDLGAIRGNEQHLGLPSDDSEDDDYDPDAPNVNPDGEKESSSSDFTSASGDRGAAMGTSDNDEAVGPSLELDQVGNSPSVSGRRHVDRLDYKKLFDEEYGNAASESSDDEEWTASRRKDGVDGSVSVSSDNDASASSGAPKRRGRKKRLDPSANGSPAKLVLNGDVSVSGNATKSTDTPRRRGRKKKVDQSTNGSPATLALNGDASGDPTKSTDTPRRRGRKKKVDQAASDSPVQLTKSSQTTCSSGGTGKRQSHNRRLGEVVKQKLYESFKVNQYPDRSEKGKLAEELGLTLQQVDKWFGNARWSFNHHPSRLAASAAGSMSPGDGIQQNAACNGAESASVDGNTAVPESLATDSNKMNTNQSSGTKDTRKSPRKRKNREDEQPTVESLGAEISIEVSQPDTIPSPEAQEGKKLRRGRSRLNS